MLRLAALLALEAVPAATCIPDYDGADADDCLSLTTACSAHEHVPIRLGGWVSLLLADSYSLHRVGWCCWPVTIPTGIPRQSLSVTQTKRA